MPALIEAMLSELLRFKRTVEFAGLTEESASLPPRGEDSAETQDPGAVTVEWGSRGTNQPLLPSPVAPMTSLPATAPPPIQFPVQGGGTVIVQSTVPLTERAWDQMMTVLQTLKSAIVVPEPSEVPTVRLTPSSLENPTDEGEDGNYPLTGQNLQVYHDGYRPVVWTGGEY